MILTRGINSRIARPGQVLSLGRVRFDPARFFASGEVGHWPDGYAPAGGRLFQDSAGTTGVATFGQPVGLINPRGGALTASQATSLSRPTLARWPKGGRRNIALQSRADTHWQAGGSSPPTVLLSQTHLGQPCAAITFAAGTPAGFSVSRADRHLAGVPHPISPGVTYAMASTISFSRQLAAGEWIAAYQTGSAAANYLLLTEANTASLVNAWHRVGHPVETATGIPGSAYPVVFVSQALGATPLTVYIRDIQIEVGTAVTAYQRTTTAFDATETGVPDVWHLSDDGNDSLNATLPAGTYTRASVDHLGAVTINEGVALYGSENVLRGTQQADVLYINRALTAGEQAVLTAYWQARYAA